MAEAPDTADPPVWHFANAEFDEGQRELRVDGEVVPLEAKPQKVLLALLRARGGLVSKQALFDTVWAGRVVTDGVLSQAIKRIRDALGSDGAEILKTAHRQGYRITAEIRRAAAPGPGADDAVVPGPVRTDGRIAICVLPFTNISGDPEQDYFSDGVTEDIITDLGKVSSLTVVSRNTSFAWKGQTPSAGEVGQALDVGYVVEGSVRKACTRVRISAQLVSVRDDRQMWAERYDRDLDDIFAVQDEISAAIVDALKIRLLPEERRAIETRSTDNPMAYKLYLMARQFRASINPRCYPLVIRLCERAVQLDPGYARAWALMGIAQSLMDLLGGGRHDPRPAIERALELDPDLADAHAAQARLHFGSGDYAAARVSIETALALDADAYDVHDAAARYAIGVHDYARALTHLERIAEIAPADCWGLTMATQCHAALGNAEQVRVYARRAMDRIERQVAAEPDHGTALSFGVGCLARLGETDRALEWAERALLLDPDNINLQYNMACAMVHLQEFERAYALLEQCFAVSTRQGLEWYRVDNDLDPLREQPRFQELLRQVEARVGAAVS